MPNNIDFKHISRMFPFEFFDELSEHLTGYAMTNPAVLLRDQLNQEQRKKLFNDEVHNTTRIALCHNNIIEAEPFGELLLLDVCCAETDINIMLGKTGDRSQVPLSFLVAQLYDSSEQPVFAKDVTEETIEQIPEVLWDDPNLALAIVTFAEQDAQIGIIKIPESLEKKMFETIDDPQADNGETARDE